MNNINLLAVLFITAMALVSCSVSDDIYDKEVNTTVRFTAGIEQVGEVEKSRAAGTEWAARDAVGIFMVRSGTALAENKKYEVQTAGPTANFEPVAGHEIYYPQGDPTVDFVAYYPYQANATLGTPIPVTIATTQTSANQPTFDLLYSNNAVNVSDPDNAVNLSFTHILARLVMKINVGDGLSAADLAEMTVTVKGMNTRNIFDLSNGTLDNPGTVADITPRTLTDGSAYDAIILPSTSIAAEGDYSVDFTIYPGTANAETFTWAMVVGTDFEGGNQYIYTVTIARSGITATGTITPWTNLDRGLVTAE